MIDEGLAVINDGTVAQQAVNYLLERIRCDVDLRYLMVDTEAFSLLIKAEAERTGRSAFDMEEYYYAPAPHVKNDKPRLATYKARMEKIGELASAAALGEKTPRVALDEINQIATASPYKSL